MSDILRYAGIHQINRTIFPFFMETLESPPNSFGLTRREVEVLSWIAQGKTNCEIGMIINASTGTICKHVEHILAKLHVENRTAAAVVALACVSQRQ